MLPAGKLVGAAKIRELAEGLAVTLNDVLLLANMEDRKRARAALQVLDGHGYSPRSDGERLSSTEKLSTRNLLIQAKSVEPDHPVGLRRNIYGADRGEINGDGGRSIAMRASY
jgi:hypothetical protein